MLVDKIGDFLFSELGLLQQFSMLSDVCLKLVLLFLEQPDDILQFVLLRDLVPDLQHVLLYLLLVEVVLLVVKLILPLEFLLLLQQILDIQPMSPQLTLINTMPITLSYRALLQLQSSASFLQELLLRALGQSGHHALQVPEMAIFTMQQFCLLLLPAHETTEGVIQQFFQVLFFDGVKFDVVLLDYILPL